jgi:hypothetical protein
MNAAPRPDIEFIAELEGEIDDALRCMLARKTCKSNWLPHQYTALRRCMAKVKTAMDAAEAKKNKRTSTE